MIIFNSNDVPKDFDPISLSSILFTHTVLDTSLFSNEDIERRDVEANRLLKDSNPRGRDEEQHKHDILIGLNIEGLIAKTLGLVPFESKLVDPFYYDINYKGYFIEVKSQKTLYSKKYPVQFYRNSIFYFLQHKNNIDYLLVTHYDDKNDNYHLKYLTFPKMDSKFEFYNSKFNGPDMFLSTEATIFQMC